MVVTIERAFLVYLPLRAKTITQPKYSFIVIISVCLFCTSVYLHYFWTYGQDYDIIDGEEVFVGSCSISTEDASLSYYMEYIRPWQDFVIRSAIPFATLLVCNILIITRLARQHKTRQEMTQSTDNKAIKHKEAQMKSLTAMLLTVSFTHLVCIAPMQIMYIIDKSDPFGWEINERWEALVALRWGFAVSIYYLNHGINFLLYIISSKEFRKDFRRLWYKIKRKFKCLNTSVHPGFRESSVTEDQNVSKGQTK